MSILDNVLKEAHWIGKQAKEFSNPEQLKKYLKDHPGADPKHHKVVEKGKGGLKEKLKQKIQEMKEKKEVKKERVKARTELVNKVFPGDDTVVRDSGMELVYNGITNSIKIKDVEGKHVKKDSEELARDIKIDMKDPSKNSLEVMEALKSTKYWPDFKKYFGM